MTITKVCKSPECQAEYEPRYFELLNTKIIAGQGWCPACARKEYNRLEADEERKKLADISHIRTEARKRTGIPPIFMNEDFSTFKKGYQDQALAKCMSYAEGYSVEEKQMGYPSFLIYSQKSWGVGKTHLSCAILHRILDRWKGEGRSCPRLVFISEYDLFRSIQATYSFTREEQQHRENEDEIIKRLTTCDLMVLDDVGKEARKDPQFVQRTLFAIIDGRYKRNAPIILTANKSPEQLKSHLGSRGSDEASYDRLWAMVGGKALNMDGSSYRRLKK